MIRRPPRSTLFPTRRSSDLHGFSYLRIGLMIRCFIYTIGFSAQHLRSDEHTSELQSQSNLVFPLFFFFNDTATTEIYTLSYTTLFRSAWFQLSSDWAYDTLFHIHYRIFCTAPQLLVPSCLPRRCLNRNLPRLHGTFPEDYRKK